ncbi:hypothetical protein GQ457_01G031130 [Hibiscus cannabinus]
MLSSAKTALLVHRVPVRVLVYRHSKLPLLVVGFLAPQYRYEHMGIDTPSVVCRYCLHRIGTNLHPRYRYAMVCIGTHPLYRYNHLFLEKLSNLKTLMGISTPCTVSVPKA